MTATLQTQLKAASTATPSFTPVRSGLLQRKCACGGTPSLSGECEECRKKKLQRKVRDSEAATQPERGFSTPWGVP